MRSLRLKLILTFLIISITGTLLTTLIVRFSNERAFNTLLQEQEQTNFVSELLAYYEENGSWQGVNEAINGTVSPDSADSQRDIHDQPPDAQTDRHLPFILADENGRVVIPNRQYKPESIVPPDILTKGLPLQVAGVQVGTMLVDDQPPARNPAEETFAAQTNWALFMGALGGTAVAVILAIIMARTLTKPLQELAAASRQMAQGNLQQEVPVRTQDELGELAAAFNQMSADLAQANQARRQMTADIAHDLRTPLTVLSGYLEAMEDGTLSPTPGRLHMMYQEVEALKRLVEDLRTLSLADTGRLALHIEPVVMADLLAQVQTAYAHQARQQDVIIEVETAVTQPPIALDQARMRQVLNNLVSNALRYTPAGGKIKLSSSTKNNRSQVTIADNGYGIPEADLPYIFNRFYRGDPSRQEGHGESGLGLAIVKSLVEAMGGEISVKSAGINQGTSFVITFST